MPAQVMQKHLESLREQLGKNPPLSEAEREDLRVLMAQIESEIQLENSTQDASIADGVNMAVERFEVEHFLSIAKANSEPGAAQKLFPPEVFQWLNEAADRE